MRKTYGFRMRVARIAVCAMVFLAACAIASSQCAADEGPFEGLTVTCAYADQQMGASDADAVQATIADVTESPEAYDGQTVCIRGEAVGRVINADEGHRWVNLEANDATVGVYMSAEDASKVTVLGSYSSTGTRLEVVGVFHASCDAGHSGELDIHADQVSVRKEGRADRAPDVDIPVALLALAVCGIGVALFFRYHYLVNRD